MINDAVAEVLKRLRNQKEVTQGEFALEVGVHRTYISQLERGLKSPSYNIVYKICQALDITLTKFASLVEEELENE